MSMSRFLVPIARLGLITALLAAVSALLTSAPHTGFTVRDKAYYADANQVAFVRPGLVLKIQGAEIGADGLIRVRFKITDPKGLPLDRDGVYTPGPVATSFVASYIPAGEKQYKAYSTRVFSNPKGGTVTDPWTDAGGVYEKTADGEYIYTFVTRAPAGYDATVTHTVGGQASRDLTEFDMGKFVDNDVYNFVPNGSPVTVVRDVVRTDTCNRRCHDPMQMHGSRRKVELCVLCHQPQNLDPYGGSLNFPVIIHKIHRGADMPSVKAGTPLWINGPKNDFSDVEFPANVRNCEVCHDPDSGAAQANAWLKPNRAACGACHDNVNFDTGQGHADLPQISDNMCANCHIPQGEIEFDASIRGAHLDPRFSRDLPGLVFDILSVDDGVAGKRPTVTFTVKDKAGTPVALSSMARIALVLAGPAKDYAGMIVDDAAKSQGSDGRYTWTFSAPVPANSQGTFSVGIEGYRNIKLLPGTKKEITVRDAGMNKVTYFSVDGSPVTPRRTVVQIEKCNACHLKLEMHGSNRNRIEHCVQCHNPNQTDASRRPANALPGETIAFKTMIHRIHTGEDLKIEYTIYGYGGRPNDFTQKIFPGDRRNCVKCHVNNSEQLPLPDGLLSVTNPRGAVNPMGPAAAACLGCHTKTAVASHVLSSTNSLGESCEVCHGSGAEFSVNRVHAH